MKKTIIITEKQKEKIKSAMSQVHNKVNAACLDSIMVCEGENQKWTMYRGYKKEFGSQRNYLLWLTDDPSYAKEYGDTIDEFVIDGNKVNASIYTIDGYDNEFDYYDGPSQEATVEAMKDGVGGYCFYVNNDDTFCVCLWDNSAILSQRTLTPEEYDSIENQNLEEENIPSEYEIGYDVPGDPNSYAHVIKESIKSMLKDGVEKKLRATVKQMVKDGSLPTDYSLEMAEWYYNIIAKALNIKRDDVYDIIRKDDRYYYSIIDDEFEKCGGKYDLMDCENHRKGMKKDLEKLHHIQETKNDKGQTIPKKCDKCGGKINLEIHGEPVYVCTKCGKYFGTMPFNKSINEGKPKSDVLDPRRVYTVLEFERILKANGYVCVNQVGSHRKYINPNRPDRRPIILVVHEKNSVLKVGATRDIILNYNLVPEKVAKAVLRENIEWNNAFSYKPYVKSIMDFLEGEGIQMRPYPSFSMKKEEQEGLYIRTGYYDPVNKQVVAFVKNRHPKDVLRSITHELIHHNQNITGIIEKNGYSGQNIKDDSELEKLESDAYLRGNIYFRKWTETMKPDIYREKKPLNESIINEAYTNQWGEQEVMMSIYYYPNPVEDEDDEPTYHICGFDTSEQNFAKWNEDYDYDDLVRTFGQEVANDIQNGIGTPTNYRYNNQPCKYINYDTTQDINIYDVNQVNVEAKKWFEVVDDVREADFILIDGTLLSVGRQTKGMDHANISRIGGIDKYQFVNLGNIRINSCGELSIDCGKMPTQEEIERLRELIATNRRGHSIIVDCGSGKSADYKDYEVGDIIPDIINYFSSGVWAKDKENDYFKRFLEEGIADISDLEVLPCFDYYKDKGIREICHAIKDGDQQAIHYAGEKMANYVGPDDVLIPIPSRTGNAIQTLLLAKEIAKKSGSKIDNILNGKNRESLYNLKKQGIEPGDDFFGFHSNGTENTNLVLIDNVLDTGMTVRAAANATGAKKVLVFAKTTENKILAEGLYEDLDPEDVDLSSFEIQDELNPKFWKDGVLDSRIRLKLLDIADDFVDSLDVNWVEPEDIIMTGSLANYNWNEEYSDIDLHIVIDFSKVDERTDFVKEYFDSKKKLWNEEHSELSIMGFPVEVYVQDANEKHTSSGIYSLDKNAWVVEPTSDNFNTSDFDDSLVREKVSQYANKIDEFIDSFKNNTDEYNLRTIYKRAAKVFKEIKNERKNGFEKGGGEYNTGNIIFKTLRRNGYIEKLQKLRIKIYNELRSLS